MGALVDEAAMRAEIQRLQEQMQRLQQVQARQPAIRDMDTPHTFYQNRSAICPPPCERNDYEIKPQMFTLVKQYMFYGLLAENPMDHIENFEEICSTTKANGVSPDFIKCKLFSFSLGDKASRWLKSLPPGSLKTWEECRAAFLDHFYTKAKTASLRNKITTFQQHSGESFCEAWERFKEYRRECPHHGFSDSQILSIFYDGVERDYKTTLNAASNGDFMTQSEQGAYKLIENLASSSNNRSAEYDRSKRINSIESQNFEELNEKVNLLLKATQRSVQFCEHGERTNELQEVNYVDGQRFVQNRGYNPNYTQDQQFQRNSSVQNAGFTGSLGFSRQAGVQNPGFQKNCSQDFVQNSGVNNFSSVQNQGQNNFQNQTPVSSIPAFQETKLEILMQQLLLNQQKSSSEINVKVDNMYNDLHGKFEALSTHVKKLDVQVAQTTEAVKKQGETNLREQCNVILVQSEMETDPIPLTPKRVEEISESLPYIPRIPYPQKLKYEIDEKKLVEFNKMVRELPPGVSFEDAYRADSAYRKFSRDTNKSLTVVKALFVEAKRIAPPMKLLSKVEDPGKFVVPCSISGVDFEESLCDSGSSINLMSKAIAEKLGIIDIRPARMSLKFADSSTKVPHGTIHDLQVQVGNCLVPTDFQVVEMCGDPGMPLILGRPFMATVGAIVDLPNKRVSFSNVDKEVFYKATPTNEATRLASCVSIIHGEQLLVVTKKEHDDKSEVKEVLDGDPLITTKKTRQKAKTKEKVKCQGIKGDSHMILVPQRRVSNTIEYKVKCKGTSKPFSKVRAILTSELKEKGEEAVKGLLSKVLELKIMDCGACFRPSTHVHLPD